jgi:hypothetical protein
MRPAKYLAAAVLSATAACTCLQAAEPRVAVHPKDTGAALANPGMGWVFP